MQPLCTTCIAVAHGWSAGLSMDNHVSERVPSRSTTPIDSAARRRSFRLILAVPILVIVGVLVGAETLTTTFGIEPYFRVDGSRLDDRRQVCWFCPSAADDSLSTEIPSLVGSTGTCSCCDCTTGSTFTYCCYATRYPSTDEDQCCPPGHAVPAMPFTLSRSAAIGQVGCWRCRTTSSWRCSTLFAAVVTGGRDGSPITVSPGRYPTRVVRVRRRRPAVEQPRDRVRVHPVPPTATLTHAALSPDRGSACGPFAGALADSVDRPEAPRAHRAPSSRPDARVGALTQSLSVTIAMRLEGRSDLAGSMRAERCLEVLDDGRPRRETRS